MFVIITGAQDGSSSARSPANLKPVRTMHDTTPNPSQARIQANRQNAKKSTGPRTAAGKAATSRNALTHGLTAQTYVLPGDDPEEFTALLDDLFRRFHPDGPAEERLVRRIAANQWRLDRAFPLEAAVLRARLRNGASRLSQPPRAGPTDR